MTKGDRIKLVRPMGVFDNIGEVCEVISVSEDGLIGFKFGGHNLGYMSYDEFKKYFEFVENELDLEEDEDALGAEEGTEDLENNELRELFDWCMKNDKPFIPKLYYKIIEKRHDITKSILGMYTNRLCLAQYKNKTFKDSDFSSVKVVEEDFSSVKVVEDGK